MSGPLRKCSTSLRWRVVSSSLSLSPIVRFRSPLQSKLLGHNQHISRPSTIRYFQCYSSGREPASSAAAELADGRLEQQTQNSRRPTDKQIDESIAMGPATSFVELAERKVVTPVIVDTLVKSMGLSTMTQVQSLTIHESLKGKDVVAQAKTGTGKTLAFLIPILQKILEQDPSLARRRMRYGATSSDIRALIISPTRELAEQIASEARKLVQNTGVVVQTAVGGTQKSQHLRNMQREGCHILVGTPGRLNDVLGDPSTGVSCPDLDAFVLDEADRLLDQGFYPAIREIMDLLPDPRAKDRQSLLYSATIPREVVDLARSIMKPDLHYVRTVQDDEVPTHELVQQKVVMVPGLENQLPAVLELCEREIKASLDPQTNIPRFKAIVYFNTTAEATLGANIFINLRRMRASPESDSFDPSQFLQQTRVYPIHARLTQQQRTLAAESFRRAESAILMSSDVTARGMDFPNVTHVIQVGLPGTRDLYIHRIGRTARAGHRGEGWLILPISSQNEARQRLGKLPLNLDKTLETTQVDMLEETENGEPPQMSERAAQIFNKVKDASQSVPPEDLQSTYRALLGNFQWWKNKEGVIELMNGLAKVQWGMEKPPPIPRLLAQKLGLAGIKGVNIGEPMRPREPRPDRFGHGAGSFGDFVRERQPRTGRDRDMGPNSFSSFGRGGSRDNGDFAQQVFGGMDRGSRGGGFRRDGRGYGRGGYGTERDENRGGSPF